MESVESRTGPDHNSTQDTDVQSAHTTSPLDLDESSEDERASISNNRREKRPVHNVRPSRNATNTSSNVQRRDINALLRVMYRQSQNQERILRALEQKAPDGRRPKHNKHLSSRIKPRNFDYRPRALQEFFSAQNLTPEQLQQCCRWFLAQCAQVPRRESKYYNLIRKTHGAIVVVRRQESDVIAGGRVEVPWRRLRLDEPDLVATVLSITPRIKELWCLRMRSQESEISLPDLHSRVYEEMRQRIPVDLGLWTELHACTYDRKGVVKERRWLTRSANNVIRSSSQQVRLAPDQPEDVDFPWFDKVHGEIWVFKPDDNFLSFKAVAFILSLCHVYDNGESIAWHRRKAFDFLHSYSSALQLNYYPFVEISDMVFAEWTIRSLVMELLPVTRSRNPVEQDGLQAHRERGRLSSVDGEHEYQIEEARISVYLVTKPTLHLPAFTIIYLSDSLEFPRNRYTQPNGCFGGIAKYLATVYGTLEEWQQESNAFLDKIDDLVRVKISDVLNDNERELLMFDNSFVRSELYFTILQMLRIFEEWIHESKKDLKNLNENCMELITTHIGFPRSGPQHAKYTDAYDPLQDLEIKELEELWDETLSLQESICKSLLDRMEAKSDEVKSLRDGLFNATSVLEASRSTKLNQYIVVFTVMTIFYLPLSFVATIFGMHLFDGPEDEKTQSNFYITIVVVSVVTYAVSLFGLWAVRSRRRKQLLQNAWRNFFKAVWGKSTALRKKTTQDGTGSDGPHDKIVEPNSNIKRVLTGLRRRRGMKNEKDSEKGNSREDAPVSETSGGESSGRDSLEEPGGMVIGIKSRRQSGRSERSSSRSRSRYESDSLSQSEDS